MTTTELRKQISIFIPLSDWRALRAEAARQKIPITELCRRWMSPGMSGLTREPKLESSLPPNQSESHKTRTSKEQKRPPFPLRSRENGSCSSSDRAWK